MIIKVGIGELKVGRNPDRLVTFNLGSCVGIALYDPVAKVGGLAHIKLSGSFFKNSGGSDDEESEAGVYPDTAVPELLKQLAGMGGVRRRMVAKIAGGGFMFDTHNYDPEKIDNMDIGRRNVSAVRKTLESYGIKISGEETHGKIPRTMELEFDTGKVFIKTKGMRDRVI